MAAELARRNGASVAEERLVADAALVHHYPPELLSPETTASTLAIMQRQCQVEPFQLDPTARRRHLETLLKVLKAFHSASLNNRGDALAGLLTVANFYVERIEAAKPDADPRGEAYDILRRKASDGWIQPAAFRALQSFPRPAPADLLRTVSQLPVYPAIALKALALAAGDPASYSQISAMVSKDQVLAGRLIHAANSCLYSPVGQITTIGHAISYIGLEETRRIVTAASMRPLFASSELGAIWTHSLETSRRAEDLAERGGRISKDEAFLAGLMHDVGRLLEVKYSGEASVAYHRLLEGGCDPAFAETCIFGCDHAELGAMVLTGWSFPEPIVEAVRCHHRPEVANGGLAALLFLAEIQEATEGGEPSEAALEHAYAATGLSLEQLAAESDLGLLRSVA
ncbi:MAG: HDOD domain-containing protein [Acidobacteria bacterium]|nr:HDOD domain-containing protein [Acidobacteriota bacterium]